MQEETLLQTIINQESWDDLIVHIVTMEDLDPWDVDLVKLTDSFLKYVENMEKLDFRIPAKVVLVAAILLKLKSDILNPLIRPKESGNSFNVFSLEVEDYEHVKEKMLQIDLHPVVKRKIKRKVTLDELVSALKKAVKVHEKRKEKKTRIGRRVEREIDITEEDIENRIMALMDDIDGLMAGLDSEKVEFSKIVKKWNRDEIITHFMPLLHLSNRGEVLMEQEDFFKEILISKRKEI
jgi:segregation and condensation protein A